MKTYPSQNVGPISGSTAGHMSHYINIKSRCRCWHTGVKESGTQLEVLSKEAVGRVNACASSPSYFEIVRTCLTPDGQSLKYYGAHPGARHCRGRSRGEAAGADPGARLQGQIQGRCTAGADPGARHCRGRSRGKAAGADPGERLQGQIQGRGTAGADPEGEAAGADPGRGVYSFAS